MKYLVSGYCVVPVKAEMVVDANTSAQAMKIAKARFKEDPRSLLVPGTQDEASACDWQPSTDAYTD
jgi:hypothetical protein